MPFNVLQAVMILLVTVSLVSLALPWAVGAIGESFDIVEVGNIKSQFDACSERILETARTGTTNTCFFNINRGELIGKAEGLSYNIVSSAPICDAHSLTKIDERRHIWQKCSVSGKYRNYEMIWMFPKELEVNGTGVRGNKVAGESDAGNIGFPSEIIFRTLSVYVAFEYSPNVSGNVVEMSRSSINDDNVTLSVRIY
jgi:hypothetical protein